MGNFVGREEWISRFNDYMHPDEGLIWRITGVPGIGKSSLMREFARRCEEFKAPYVWLDLEGYQPGHGLDILTELSKSARFFDTDKSNKTLWERLGEGFTYTKDGLGSALEVGKLVDPTGGLITGGAKVLLALSTGVAGSAANMSEEAAAANPELFLLEALAAAGKDKPFCLVDTFEHVISGDLKLETRLDFGFASPRETNLKTQAVAGWLNHLFEFLRSKGWRIVVAGRNMHEAKMEDQLTRFTRTEIQEAASKRPGLESYLPDQADEIIDVLSTLSFEGNPLWLQVAMNLLENLLEEGEDLTQLASKPDYLHECFEDEDAADLGASYGVEFASCKLQLIQTLTRHIEGIEDQAWKIALPRVLNQGILAQLFEKKQAKAIHHNFTVAGVFRGNRKQFTLHEEIRDLLLAYARSKGWLDSEETRALHGCLWDYINTQFNAQDSAKKINSPFFDSSGNSGGVSETFISEAFNQHAAFEAHFPRHWILEACYHRFLSGVGLVEKAIPIRDFAYALMGSASLTVFAKWQIARSLPELDNFQCSELLRILTEEADKWVGVFGKAVATRLIIDIAEGKVSDIATDVSYWKQQVENSGLCGDFIGHIGALQATEAAPEKIVSAVDDLLERYADSGHPEVQAQCATALYNKGVTLGEKLNDPQGAVETYDRLLERYADSGHPEVQAECARALTNKGWTLANKLNDPQSAVETYDRLLEHYADSDHPEVQAQCAKALYNKGVTLAHKLNDPQGEIATYDRLLGRYGDSRHPEVQAQCAKALTNKGVTLGEKLNDPQSAVETYDRLLERYADSGHPEVQAQCAKALYNKGVTLAHKLNDPQSAVETCDRLLEHYADSGHPEVQAECARALDNKGIVFGRKGDYLKAVACFDELLSRYGNIENSTVQQACLRALANSTEPLLLLGQNEKAVERLQNVLTHTNQQEQEAAIIPFLLWLAESETTEQAVVASIHQLSPEVAFTWSWDDIRPLVNKLPEPRKTKAECFISYFEQHQNIEALEACLARTC